MSSVHGQSPASSTLEKSPGPSQDELGNGAPPEIQPENQWIKAIQAVERSRAIDQALEEDGRIRKQQCNVLPLGAFKEREIIEMLLKKDPEIGLTRNELLDYRQNIHQWIAACASELVSFIETSDFRLEPDAKIKHGYLRGYLSSLDPDAYLSEEFGKAVETLWNDALLRDAFESAAADTESTDPSTTYAFTHIARLTTLSYIPTEQDVLHSHHCFRGATTYRVPTSSLTLHLVDPGLQRGERRKWFHTMDNMRAVLFVADLCQHHLLVDSNISRAEAITEQIVLFETVVNWRLFGDTVFVLFLSNVSGFARELETRPLREEFAEYTGGESWEEAGKWLMRRFEAVVKGGRKVVSHLVDLEPWDPRNVEMLGAAIKKGLDEASGTETCESEGG